MSIRRLAAACVLALAGARALAAQRPAWAELEGMVLGGPLDAVFPLGLECRPGSAFGGPVSPVALITVLFGNAFAHSHHNGAAAVRALEPATVCMGKIWEGQAVALVFAMNRQIGAITVLYALRPDSAMPVEAVRRRLRARWGRGAGTATLEEWWGERYRAYLLDAATDDRFGRRVTLLDLRACTAFDRALHQAGEPGRPGVC